MKCKSLHTHLCIVQFHTTFVVIMLTDLADVILLFPLHVFRIAEEKFYMILYTRYVFNLNNQHRYMFC